MDDKPNDMWAYGMTLHQVLTCTSPDWGPALGPSVGPEPGLALPAAIRKADVVSKHASWVRQSAMTPCMAQHAVQS